jgi:hypothetical protein
MATVYPTASTMPTATECLTVSRVAPQRMAGITGRVGEGAAQVAGKGGAVICSTAVGHSLRLSGHSGMTSATVP